MTFQTLDMRAYSHKIFNSKEPQENKKMTFFGTFLTVIREHEKGTDDGGNQTLQQAFLVEF